MSSEQHLRETLEEVLSSLKAYQHWKPSMLEALIDRIETALNPHERARSARSLKEEYRVLREVGPEGSGLQRRLFAHHAVLQFGMIDAGDSARQIRIAEAAADIALALARKQP